jgi:hypothetical protein
LLPKDKINIHPYARYLDTHGNVFTLPTNLTLPFARCVALLQIESFRRYQIDRVYASSSSVTAHSSQHGSLKERQVDGDLFQNEELVYDVISSCDIQSYRSNLQEFLLAESIHTTSRLPSHHEVSQSSILEEFQSQLLNKSSLLMELQTDVEIVHVSISLITQPLRGNIASQSMITPKNESISLSTLLPNITFRFTNYAIVEALFSVVFTNHNESRSSLLSPKRRAVVPIKQTTTATTAKSVTSGSSITLFQSTNPLVENFLLLLHFLCLSTSLDVSMEILQSFVIELSLDDIVKFRMVPFLKVLSCQQQNEFVGFNAAIKLLDSLEKVKSFYIYVVCYYYILFFPCILICICTTNIHT